MAKQPLNNDWLDLEEEAQEAKAGKKEKFLAKLSLLKARFLAPFASFKKNLSRRQKILLLAFVTVVIFTSALIWLFNKKSPTPPAAVAQTQQESDIPDSIKSLPKIKNSIPLNIDSEMNSLIQKANILYNHGDKLEALNVFERINAFSQSLANYNLGVIQMDQGDFDSAQKSFIQAINAGEDISLSSLAAALASLKMRDMSSYAYYLNQATQTLPQETQRPFYSYLYALVSFYNQNYFASLSSLNNPSSPAYIPASSAIGAKSYLIFNDAENAIKSLESAPEKSRDLKNLGLLYARLGDYATAKKQLQAYIDQHPKDIGAYMASELIAVKTGDYLEAAKILESLSDPRFEKEALEAYPIKVVLNSRLFDIDEAQKNFINQGLGNSGFIADKLLFYYAPFKVFNPDQSLQILKESGILYAVNLEAAKQKVMDSQTINRINDEITKALVVIYRDHDLRGALKLLQTSIQNNPSHSILHYDAAVLFAQMGEYEKAYHHFLKSYHLDPANIDSGLFAILANHFLQRNDKRLMADINQDLSNLPVHDEKRSFLYAFLNYLNQSSANDMAWIDETNPLPIYHALKAAYSLQAKNYTSANAAFEALGKIYPQDLVTLTMQNITQNPTEGFKDTALKLHQMLLKQKLDLKSVYFGPLLAREFYVYVGFVAGTLPIQEAQVQERLIAQRENTNGILQTLALLYIYQHKFKQASAVYDLLINQLKEEDSSTQLLAAVAAVGSGDYDNAALSLQLSKMGSKANYESRFVLGLLYQQAGRLKAAANHFNVIANKRFSSDYFDFAIDNEKILHHIESQ